MRPKVRLEIAAYLLFLASVLALPQFVDEFWLNRMAKYLVYGIVGVSIALVWGYAGILNLGQGLFFGLGAYMLAMSLKLSSPTSLTQGSDTPVPDFMLWNAEPGAPTELCCISKASFLWLPFQSQGFGILMGLALPMALALALGAALFRSRVSGVYVAIITVASALLVRLLIIDWQPVTNGFNGLTDLGYLTVLGHEFDPFAAETYYLVAISLAVVLVLCRLLLASRAGLILQATRDDPNRARYLGYDVAGYQLFFFVLSAGIAGYAGMLYVAVAQFASPTFMNIASSVSMVVWVAVGGRGSLLGAALGAILLNLVEAAASETELLVEAWQLLIGVLFVVVVLFLPKGLAGLADSTANRLLARRSREAPMAPPREVAAGPARRPGAEVA